MGSTSPVVAVATLLASLALSAIAVPARSEEEVWDLYKGWLLRHQQGLATTPLGRRSEHNGAFDAGKRSSHLGLTRFIDLTNNKFRATYLDVCTTGHRRSSEGSDWHLYPAGDELSEQVDWNEKGTAVTIKHQGSCCVVGRSRRWRPWSGSTRS